MRLNCNTSLNLYMHPGYQKQIQVSIIRCFSRVFSDSKLRHICYTNNTDHKTLPLFIVVVIRVVGVVADRVVDTVVEGFFVVGLSVVGGTVITDTTLTVNK